MAAVATRYPGGVKAASARSAREMLDAVQSLARLDALACDDYAGQLAAEVAARDTSEAGLAERDLALTAALGTLDGFAARAMRIRLEPRALNWRLRQRNRWRQER